MELRDRDIKNSFTARIGQANDGNTAASQLREASPTTKRFDAHHAVTTRYLGAGDLALTVNFAIM